MAFAGLPKDSSEIRNLEDTILKERQSEILIKYKPGGNFRKINSNSLSGNVQSRSEIDSDIELLRLKNDVNTQKILEELNQNEFVEHAEVNGVSYLTGAESPVADKQQLDTEHQKVEDYNKLLREKKACSSRGNLAESENINDLKANLKAINELKDDTSFVSSSDTIFEREPNDSIWMANKIELDKYVCGTITDFYFDLDYYRLEINQAGRLNIVGAFTYPEYLAIGLLDANGDHVAWSFLSYTGGAQILSKTVRPGTYYILVLQTSDYKYLCTDELYTFTAWMSNTSHVPVSSVSLNKNNLDMIKGTTATLNATVLPSNATNKSVKWTSSDTSVATVNSDGRVKARGVGDAVITVRTVDKGKTDTCHVRVSDLPAVDNPLKVNDPYYEKQWWLQSVNAPSVWEKISSNDPIVVAVIDSGIEQRHDDLKNRIASGGYNFINNSRYVYDINGHGTAVSGTIVAEANNNKGIAGVTGPLNVKVLPLQAGYYDGSLYRSDIVRSINYAIDMGVDVINLSCGSDSYSYIENQAIQDAISKGIVVVASAGNDGKRLYKYPASYDNVISVGSISPNDSISSFSNYNNKVDFVAPGEDIYTTGLYNSYNYCDGTSFSTPIASGVVAMMKAVDPTLSPKDINRLLAENAIDKGPLGKDIYYGHGLIDAYATINSLTGFEVPVTSVSLNKTNITIEEGKTTKLSATVLPKDATNKLVSWSSSNPNIVKVNKQGKVTAVSEGTATITVKTSDGNKTASCLVKVTSPKDEYRELPAKTNVPLDKEWKVTFNMGLNPDDVNNDSIYVVNEKNNKVDIKVSLNSDRKSLTVSPVRPYEQGKTYYLIITNKVTSEKGNKLKRPVRMRFSTGSIR